MLIIQLKLIIKMRVTVILIIKTWPYRELSFFRTSAQDLILSYCFQRKWSFVITKGLCKTSDDEHVTFEAQCIRSLDVIYLYIPWNSTLANPLQLYTPAWQFVCWFLLYDTLYIPGYYAYAVPEEHTIYLTAWTLWTCLVGYICKNNHRKQCIFRVTHLAFLCLGLQESDSMDYTCSFQNALYDI